jgi:drug/metabolite transporter (DMT)-like permease
MLGQFRGIAAAGWAVALLQGVGLILFVLALEYTTAANVLIVFATTPLMAAVLGRIFLGERIPAVTWAAILASMAGLGIVTSGSLGTVHLLGDFLALCDALTLAAFYVVVRRHHEISMVPAVGLGMVVGGLLALPLASFGAVTPVQGLWILLASAVVLPLPVILLTTGARYLAAPEVPMLALLETVVGPFWVWLALGEEPGARSLIGGAVIVTTLFLHALVRLQRAGAAA